MKIKASFENKLIELPIDELLKSRDISPNVKAGHKYFQILTSIKEVGIVEPPAVAYLQEQNKYLLLDGHLRIMALKELGVKTVKCLLSTDDESYTYNKWVNGLSPVQEVRMMLRIIDGGMDKEMIAKSLGVNPKTLTNKIAMMDRISPDVIDLLKDKTMSEKVFTYLGKMKPERQLNAAKLMVDQNNYTVNFAKMLFEGTPDEQLLEQKKREKINSNFEEQQARLERENLSLTNDINKVKTEFKQIMLKLVSIQAYLKRLLDDKPVAAYLEKHHREYYEKFCQIARFDFFTPGPI